MSAYVEGSKKGNIIGDKINGYVLLQDWEIAANGLINFGKRGDDYYFLKAFTRPKYPSENSKISPKLRRKKTDQCRIFEKNYLDMIKIFKKNLNQKDGQLIFPHEFRRMSTTYLQISPRINIAHKSPKEILSYDNNSKIILLKSVTNAVSLIHMHNIVHSDLKFDNVLIQKTKSNLPSAKIIDFDGSYFGGRPHLPQFMHFDQSYMAPELSLYNQECPSILNSDMTVKADIFSLGIILHEYCTGVRPSTKNSRPGKITYLGDAINRGDEIEIKDDIIGEHLSKLIASMLSKNFNDRPSAKDVFKELSSEKIDIKKMSKAPESPKTSTTIISKPRVPRVSKVDTVGKINIISKKK